jgi:hypothetical protein
VFRHAKKPKSSPEKGLEIWQAADVSSGIPCGLKSDVLAVYQK